MCSRIAQYRFRTDYASGIGFDMGDQRSWQGGDRIQHYNIPGGAAPWVLHRLHEGAQKIDTVHWGYRPAWAVEQNIPMALNVKINRAFDGKYFRHMWKSGRIILPADGWFEWTGDQHQRQAWHIRLRSGLPMFIAAITNWIPYKTAPAGTGFVVVNDLATGSLVDQEASKPVVLAPDDALAWLDNEQSPEMALRIAMERSVERNQFEWYQVSSAVNNPLNNSRDLIKATAQI